jgi:hypothetical protein
VGGSNGLTAIFCGYTNILESTMSTKESDFTTEYAKETLSELIKDLQKVDLDDRDAWQLNRAKLTRFFYAFLDFGSCLNLDESGYLKVLKRHYEAELKQAQEAFNRGEIG